MKFTKQGPKGKCRAMRCNNNAVATISDYEICATCLPEATTTLIPPVAPELDVDALTTDATETATAVQEFIPSDAEEYMALVSMLSDMMDGKDRADNERKGLGAPMRAGWEAVNAKYNLAVDAYKAAIDACKAQIAAIREAQEMAVDEAIASGQPVPELFEMPPGLSIKPEISVIVENLEVVPEQYLTVALDTNAVLDAMVANSKLEIPGLKKHVQYKVQLRRQS